ncbi:hypothetical protein [Bacillus cereus group sp. BfR-BA-01422]|uniref:hypothetical protein n=1 Tax=Bacillus cereus group sp. BfR-BA-01422 TaxID=2920339 RepID=UPI001F573281|nr:hypothetical protein [Bacillus cereus group sp. BfR-BA-01422]
MNIEWDKVLPSVIGALTGGTMSLLGSYFSAKRQANKEEKRREYEEKRAEKIALTSVRNEVEHNYIRYKYFNDYIKTQKLPAFGFSDSGVGLGLKLDKWDKHSDIIENIEGIPYMGRLRAFYMNIHADINLGVIEAERLNTTKEMAWEIREKMTETIHENYQ